jgi:hypothetical protein
LFIPSAGMVFQVPNYAFSNEVWGYLEKGFYYARFIEAHSWRVLKTWSFIKS